jgi:hypothetical protein
MEIEENEYDPVSFMLNQYENDEILNFVEKLSNNNIEQKDFRIISGNSENIIKKIYNFALNRYIKKIYELDFTKFQNELEVDSKWITYYFEDFWLNSLYSDIIKKLNYEYDEENVTEYDMLFVTDQFMKQDIDMIMNYFPRYVGQTLYNLTVILAERINQVINKNYKKLAPNKDEPLVNWINLYLYNKQQNKELDQFGIWYEDFRKKTKKFVDKFMKYFEEAYNQLLNQILTLMVKFLDSFNKFIDPNGSFTSVDYGIDEQTWNLVPETYNMGSLFSSDEYQENTGDLISEFNDARLNWWKTSNDIVRDEMVTQSKRERLIDKDEYEYYKKSYSPYVCGNKIDVITLEEIEDKEFMKKGWIYIEYADKKVGNCYLKEDLIPGMILSAVFDWDKQQNVAKRKEKFFKLPDGIWIDKKGFDKIPTNKLLKLKYVGEKYIGSYIGVSTLHGTEPLKIYTLEKIKLPSKTQRTQTAKRKLEI